MKKLILATAPVALLMSAVPAHADSTQVIGTVVEVCEVNIAGAGLVDFFNDMSAGDSRTANVSMQCNDADGATVTVTSTEGGLESDDQEDLEIDYTAEMNLSDGTNAFSLVIDTDSGVSNQNDQSESGALPASGDVYSGTLEFTLNESAPWAGGYSDTFQIDISAN
jgi:hypothetical protein